MGLKPQRGKEWAQSMPDKGGWDYRHYDGIGVHTWRADGRIQSPPVSLSHFGWGRYSAWKREELRRCPPARTRRSPEKRSACGCRLRAEVLAVLWAESPSATKAQGSLSPAARPPTWEFPMTDQKSSNQAADCMSGPWSTGRGPVSASWLQGAGQTSAIFLLEHTDLVSGSLSELETYSSAAETEWLFLR